MRPFNERNRFFLAPLILVAIAGFGLVTMWLWNALLPQILHLPQISFWQAIGLLVLSRLLFGFSPPWRGNHNHNRNHLREKWEHMNPEQREEFKNHLRQRRPPWARPRDNRENQETTETKNS